MDRVLLGPTGDSVSTEKGILTPWPKEGLRVVWQKQVGTGYAMPSISRGRLFLFDRDRRPRPPAAAWKSETGESLWKFEYPTDYEDQYGYNNGPRCCPVVDGDRVYIYGAEGMLHCVRADDGKLVWKVDTTAEFGVVQNFFGVGSTPVVEGDLLHRAGRRQPQGQRRRRRSPTSRATAAASSPSTSSPARSSTSVTDELASYASPVLATIGGRRWCFVFARGGLVGFEPATGKVDFHFPWRAQILESVNASNPVVVGDQVFISETLRPRQRPARR